jgi:hypothetical protein
MIFIPHCCILCDAYLLQIEKNKKYAKWKAAYIHKCLRNGETPVAGPLPEEDDEGKYRSKRYYI